MGRHEGTRQRDQAAVRVAGERSDGIFNFTNVAHSIDRHLDSISSRAVFDDGQECGCRGVIQFLYNRQARNVWGNLLEQFNPMCCNCVFKKSKPGDVSAWSWHAGNKFVSYWVESLRKDDGNGSCFPLQCKGRN